MRRTKLLAALLVLLPVSVRAQTVQLSTETMINIFPDPRQRELHIVAPFIEWLRFRSEGLAGGAASIDISGWGGFDLGTSLIPGQAGADFAVGALHYDILRTGTTLDIGRQYLLLGLGRAEHFDGFHIGQKVGGFGLEIFGGEQAGPRMTWVPGDWLGGARLSYQLGHALSLGVSYLQARSGDEMARELIGADLVAASTWMELGMGALYDTVADRLAQIDGFVRLRVSQIPGLRVGLDVRRVVPVSFLDKTSIFTVFSDAVRTEYGGDISYEVNRFLTFRADGHGLLFYAGGAGYRAGVDAILAFDRLRRSILTLRVGRWRDDLDGYTEARAAARHYFTKHFFGSLDAQIYRYDNGAAHGEQFSFSTAAALGYAPTHNLRAMIAAEAGVTPQFERVAQILAKLEWNFMRSYR
jgi:hypothetical protein